MLWYKKGPFGEFKRDETVGALQRAEEGANPWSM